MAGFWFRLGALVRQAGQALDGAGMRLEGRFGYKETCALPRAKCRTLWARWAAGVNSCRECGAAVPLHQTIQQFSAAKPKLAPDTFVALTPRSSAT